ncbi:DUF934 domain-containing protein [Prosthecomicrobium pneumaticum]|uniref:Phosphoadenosine phosphosulfate reductase n=1 Tax=Prosthecomicrobium pneumaticum TaxID=81895 RepID=A0A7W9CUU2_9HYPH|nr:DUF934 domain-containing protein [Prosthecomicrobium pneumaticum]MBB5752340.1 phosphoadenosine phosphosulfate reductase [Prosthecomicrobium pneumaticum]
MALWKNRRFVEDPFRRAADDEAIAPGEAVLVSLGRYLDERETLIARSAPLGIVVPPGADWSGLVPDLGRLAVIAVEMPKFADGRAFSIGRLIRDREGYRGELRVVGDFFLDQVPFLLRVGFDAFAVDNPLVEQGLREGRWPEVKEYLQPAGEVGEVPAGTRPWIRRPAAAAE